MGVRIIEDLKTGYKAIYDSVTMVTFGPIFYEDEDIEEFFDWIGEDPRGMEVNNLIDKRIEWNKTKLKS